MDSFCFIRLKPCNVRVICASRTMRLEKFDNGFGQLQANQWRARKASDKSFPFGMVSCFQLAPLLDLPSCQCLQNPRRNCKRKIGRIPTGGW
jgi:hypothetical protein